MDRRLAALAVLLAPAATAHNGPPFPIIVDKRVGPSLIALWTHPDIGTGTFWVMVDPPPGGTVPKDLSVRVGIQPVNGRLPEVVYAAEREDQGKQVQYKVEAPFDRQEFIKARVLLTSAQGSGEASATVEVTPVGLGRWDLLLFAFPFLGVAFLWFRVVSAKRKRLLKQRSHSG